MEQQGLTVNYSPLSSLPQNIEPWIKQATKRDVLILDDCLRDIDKASSIAGQLRSLGSVAKSKFSEIGSNGGTILNQLIKDAILEEISPTEVRLKQNISLKESDIRKIARSDFDKIWAILQQSLLRTNTRPKIIFIFTTNTRDEEDEVIEFCEAHEIKLTEHFAGKTNHGQLITNKKFDNTPKADNAVGFKDGFIDIEKLSSMFYKKLQGQLDNLSSTFDEIEFLKWVRKIDRNLGYRNMETWNAIFNCIKAKAHRGEDLPNFTTLHEFVGEFQDDLYSYLERIRPGIFDKTLEKMLPFFATGIPLLSSYATSSLGITEEELTLLKIKKLIDRTYIKWDSNWINSKEIIILPNLRLSEAKLVQKINIFRKLRKNESRSNVQQGTEITLCSPIEYRETEDEKFPGEKPIIDYAALHYQNLYRIISPLSHFYHFELWDHLCKKVEFQSIIKKFLIERHLGKELDRTIRNLSCLDHETKSKLIDDEVIGILMEKCNLPALENLTTKKSGLNSKVSLLRGIYKFEPLLARKCVMKLDIDMIIADFNRPLEINLDVLTKLWEILKNVYTGYLFKLSLKFTSELQLGVISEDLRNSFVRNSYQLSEKAAIRKENEKIWSITDRENEFIAKRGYDKLIIGRRVPNDVRDSIRHLARKTIEKCSDLFIKRFDNCHFFAPLHWALKHLEQISLDNHISASVLFLENILAKEGAGKIVVWIRDKKIIRLCNIDCLLAKGKFIQLESGQTLYDYIKFCRNDMERLMAAQITTLLEIVAMLEKYPDVLLDPLLKYVDSQNFIQKLYTFNKENPKKIEEIIKRLKQIRSLPEKNLGVLLKAFLNKKDV
jgi:hypothetical protein